MKQYTYTDSGHIFERVDRRTARRVYNQGLTVLLCPVNLRPGEPWHPEAPINGKAGEPFDKVVNAFEYYNVRDSHTGHYTAYYIPVRMVDEFTHEPPTIATFSTIVEYDYTYIGGITSEAL